MAAGHNTVTLPQNKTVTQPALPTSSRLGARIAEQPRSESVTAQYSQNEHGFVLISGITNAPLQPQCTRIECVSSARVPSKAAAYRAATSDQQPVEPMKSWSSLVQRGGGVGHTGQTVGIPEDRV